MLHSFDIYIYIFFFPLLSHSFCASTISHLWTWRSWIRASWYNYENNQQDALCRLIYYSSSALHVSGDVFAHHREHLTVFRVSGSVHTKLLPAGLSLRHRPAASWGKLIYIVHLVGYFHRCYYNFCITLIYYLQQLISVVSSFIC